MPIFYVYCSFFPQQNKLGIFVFSPMWFQRLEERQVHTVLKQTCVRIGARNSSKAGIFAAPSCGPSISGREQSHPPGLSVLGCRIRRLKKLCGIPTQRAHCGLCRFPGPETGPAFAKAHFPGRAHLERQNTKPPHGAHLDSINPPLREETPKRLLSEKRRAGHRRTGERPLSFPPAKQSSGHDQRGGMPCC